MKENCGSSKSNLCSSKSNLCSWRIFRMQHFFMEWNKKILMGKNDKPYINEFYYRLSFVKKKFESRFFISWQISIFYAIKLQQLLHQCVNLSFLAVNNEGFIKKYFQTEIKSLIILYTILTTLFLIMIVK